MKHRRLMRRITRSQKMASFSVATHLPFLTPSKLHHLSHQDQSHAGAWLNGPATTAGEIERKGRRMERGVRKAGQAGDKIQQGRD